MEVVYINTIDDIKYYGGISIAHGFFDGVHSAHQDLINVAKNFTNMNDGIKTGVVTFDTKNSCDYCDKKEFIKSLTISTLDRKLELFKHFGVDIVFVINFRNFNSLSASEYINSIIVPIGTVNFVMGKDNCFGKGGVGNWENISELASNRFEVCVVDLIKDLGTKISSSEIKRNIMKNDIEISNSLLGYYYQIQGTVINGKKLGRTIGYPTANLKVHDMVIIPKISVYATLIKIDGKIYKSMTNIGFNPTVDFRDELSIETNIFDFDDDIYGKEVSLYFVCKIRDEQQFENLDALLKQLAKDKLKVKEVLKNIDYNCII